MPFHHMLGFPDTICSLKPTAHCCLAVTTPSVWKCRELRWMTLRNAVYLLTINCHHSRTWVWEQHRLLPHAILGSTLPHVSRNLKERHGMVPESLNPGSTCCCHWWTNMELFEHLYQSVSCVRHNTKLLVTETLASTRHQVEHLLVLVALNPDNSQHKERHCWIIRPRDSWKNLWRGMQVVSPSCKASAWWCHQGGDCVLEVCSWLIHAPTTNNNHQCLLSSLSN